MALGKKNKTRIQFRTRIEYTKEDQKKKLKMLRGKSELSIKV